MDKEAKLKNSDGEHGQKVDIVSWQIRTGKQKA